MPRPAHPRIPGEIPFGTFEVTIEKFTRPWQRLLGLGDVHATKESIERAVKEEDIEELTQIHPAWQTIAARGESHLLRLTPPEALMIADCEHDMRDCDLDSICANGPTNRVGKPSEMTHLEPFYKCMHCNLTLCLKCSRTAENAVDQMARECEENENAQRVWTEAQQWTFDFHQHPTAPLPFYVINLLQYEDKDSALPRHGHA